MPKVVLIFEPPVTATAWFTIIVMVVLELAVTESVTVTVSI